MYVGRYTCTVLYCTLRDADELTYIPYLRHACVAWNDASDLEYRYIRYVHVNVR